MDFELRHSGKRLAGLFLFFTGTTAYLALSTTQFFAARFSAIPSAAALRKAVNLDPVNAEYRDNLGRFEMLVQQAPADALPQLQSAVALDPSHSDYWLDRAAAEQLLGKFDAERESLDRVTAIDPHTARVAWQAANLYLSQGAVDAALREYRTVLENDPVLTPEALRVCWRVRPDIEFLLQNVIPAKADEPFLSFLVSSGEPQAAAKLWERIVSIQQPVERRFLFDYLRYLFAHNDAVQASRVWQQAANLSDLAGYQPTEENLLVNGDFNLDMLNAGFDWIYQKSSSVSLAIDPDETPIGSSRSLNIEFEGPAIEDAGIHQLVYVEPDTRYQFFANYKAEDMDGAGGAEFAIQDAYSGSSFFMSENLRDSMSWTRVEDTFTTGPETHLIVLRIAGVPANRPIRGKLWINGLKLVTSDYAASLAAQKEQP